MSAWCSDNVLPQVNLRGICKQYVKHDVPVYVCMDEQACVCVCVRVKREQKKSNSTGYPSVERGSTEHTELLISKGNQTFPPQFFLFNSDIFAEFNRRTYIRQSL